MTTRGSRRVYFPKSLFKLSISNFPAFKGLSLRFKILPPLRLKQISVYGASTALTLIGKKQGGFVGSMIRNEKALGEFSQGFMVMLPD
jgi:hypothetical protein